MSITFAVLNLGICVSMVIQIAGTAWQRRSDMREHSLPGEHRAHSLSMPLGMVSTLSILTTIGALLKHQPSMAYMLGLSIGGVVGYLTARSFDDGVMVDGIVTGTMGGLMGVMVGNMVPRTGLYMTSVVLTGMFVGVWLAQVQQVRRMNTRPSPEVGPEQPSP